MRKKSYPLGLAIYLLATAVACNAPQPVKLPPTQPDFVVRAEVLESLEGGPLVIRASLINRGVQAVKICQCNFDDNVHLEPPAAWEVRFPIRSESTGVPWGIKDLPPSGERFEVLHVHDCYSKIPAGKATVRLVWPVYGALEGQRLPDKFEDLKLLSEPTTELEVDVPAATPVRLAALRKHTEEQLHDSNLSDWDRWRLGKDIVETRHHALAPVAWRMIEAPQPPALTYDLIQFISECPEDSSDLDGRLAKLAADTHWGGRWDLFDYWRNRKTALPPAAWLTLNDAENVWTRALTYVVFSKRCGKEWKEALLADLRDQSKPLSSSRLDRLLADLDEDNFDIREKASTLLVRFGERAEGGLKSALDRPLSTEARQRVTAILEKVHKAKQPPDCVQALEYFAAHDAPENGELLQVLAEGSPDAWITQQAKKDLAEWRKARGLPDK